MLLHEKPTEKLFDQGFDETVRTKSLFITLHPHSVLTFAVECNLNKQTTKAHNSNNNTNPARATSFEHTHTQNPVSMEACVVVKVTFVIGANMMLLKTLNLDDVEGSHTHSSTHSFDRSFVCRIFDFCLLTLISLRRM